MDERTDRWMDGWTDGLKDGFISVAEKQFLAVLVNSNRTGCDAFAHSKAFIILYIKYVCRYIKTSCVRLWSRALI